MKRLLFNIFCLAASSLMAQTGGAIYDVGPTMMRTKIHTIASTLNNGKIISFGGRENGFVSCSYADMYDPVSNTFTETAMNAPHDMAAVVKLSDGQYFILGGGYDWGVPAYANTEMYNPATNTFEAKSAMIGGRMMVSAAQLTGGKVLVAGAWYVTGGEGELYDIPSNTFIATGALVQPRAQAITIPTLDGGAVVAGGWEVYNGNPAYTSVEYYNLGTNSFSTLSSEVIAADPGWILNAIYTKPIDDCRMSNGKYLFLAHRSAPSLEFALIEFNPSTKLFSKLNTDVPLLDALTDGGFIEIILNKNDNIAYLVGVDAGFAQQTLSLVQVNLTTGVANHPINTFTLPAQEYFYGAMTYVPSIGKILVQGINSYPDNFSATNKTYLLKPTLTVGIEDENTIQQLSVYPNSAQDIINIEMELTTPTEFEIQLLDITGREIMNDAKISKTTGKIHWQYSTVNIPNGVYVLKIQTISGVLAKRIVISR